MSDQTPILPRREEIEEVLRLVVEEAAAYLASVVEELVDRLR